MLATLLHLISIGPRHRTSEIFLMPHYQEIWRLPDVSVALLDSSRHIK